MKTISVPTSLEAAQRLDFDETVEEDLIEENLSEGDFATLLESGWIERVNQKLETFIDEYENETIRGQSRLTMLEDISAEYLDTTGDEIFSVIEGLAANAREFDTGVYFYF